MARDDRLPAALLGLRLGVLAAMLAWTLDKFVRPEHAAKVYATFYRLPAWGRAVFYAVGAAELLLLLAFVTGFQRRLSYGLVLALHAVSTLSSYKQYLAPFEGGNLLFFAAWPMLAACWTLYVLRDEDTLWSLPLKPPA